MKKKIFFRMKEKKRRKTIKNYFDKKSSVQLHSSQIKTAAAETKESKQHSNRPNEPLISWKSEIAIKVFVYNYNRKNS